MNKLDTKTRAQILAMLCEGASMRSVSRLTDTSINTVSKLLVDAGRFCAGFHDAKVRGVKASKVQVDEIWSFTAAKEKNVASMKAPVDGAGDTWTWTAIEAGTKLLISHFVGGRDGECAKWFIEDMASRITNRIQLTSDGHKAYLEAVEGAFGADIDYAMLVKLYGATPESAKGRYSPADCTGIKKTKIEGKPDMAHVSTSYVERANLTMRMHNRRFTRLTNAFSKKFENHAHMVAIYAVWYNWLRIHKTLRVTPAMAAGLSDTVMTWEQIVQAMDADAPKHGPRGPYKKKDHK
ncbi:IS1 family transposase [Methylocystis sp. H4A]|uniref:IS1 family transposase n=1 Tax=Methylocystis sp. H4A TaxID=2785788 RepID=UPI0018C25AEC|nr:IS1 family transposase [Methylocystis sp. H4A]MBG0801379.1 IS1 family transposase [Methylocystis sp. H4A]